MSILLATRHLAGSAPLPVPERGFVSSQPAKIWEEGLICGNGTIGANALRRPLNERIIFTHEIKTSFRAAGKWDAVSFSAVPGDKTKLSVNKSSVTSASAVNARMSPGGGFVMVIRPAR